MVGADGSVVISVEAEIDSAERELAKLKRDIEEMEADLMSQKGKKSALEEVIANGGNEAKRAKWEVEKLNSSIANTERILAAQKSSAGHLQGSIDAMYDSLEDGEEETSKIEKGLAKFSNRVVRLAKNVFIFSMISAGLRMVRGWMSEVVSKSDEATAAVANLKASLTQMATPLLNVVIPAFVFLINVLTALVQILGTFFSLLFGAGDSADALNEQADAIGNVGGAAKKASKQLAGFDTINKLSSAGGGGGGGGGSAVDLKSATAIEDKFKKIAYIVLGIGAALAGWKLASLFGLAGVNAFAFASALSGVLLLILGISDAWENGLGDSNILAILSGATLLALGLAAAFGRLGGGVGLLISGIAMLVIGIKDYLAKGELTIDNLGMIALGIMAVGAAIGLLLGNPIPALIGAIVGLAVLFAAKMGEGEALIDSFLLVLQGFAQFIKGVFTLDWETAWNGIKNIAKGVVNAVIGLLNSLINGINKLAHIKTKSYSVFGKEIIPAIDKQLFTIPNIPYLAQGAVIPPNQQFLAVLGDQKSGTNIEAPLSTIKQAVLEAMAQNGGGNKTIVLQVDDREFASIVFDMFNLESQRLGVKAE